jgi:hypothetical protein
VGQKHLKLIGLPSFCILLGVNLSQKAFYDVFEKLIIRMLREELVMERLSNGTKLS